MIQESSKSPLERFLDKVSIEFNNYYQSESHYATDEFPEIYMNAQIEILNSFLTQIDVKILSAWQDPEATQKKNKEFEDESGFQSGKKKLFESAQNLLWGISNSSVDDDGFSTLKRDTVRYKKKAYQRDGLIDRKVANTLSSMHLNDVINVLNQLYSFFSVILCVGFLGKRASWGITQLNYVNSESKCTLNKWCKLEACLKTIDDAAGNIDSASIFVPSSNISSVMGGCGWMNVLETGESEQKVQSNKASVDDVDHIDDVQFINSLVKKCEECIVKNEKLELQNLALSSENKELKLKLDELGKEIESLKLKESSRSGVGSILSELGDSGNEEIKDLLGMLSTDSIPDKERNSAKIEELVEKAKYRVCEECDEIYSKILIKDTELYENKIQRLEDHLEDYKEEITPLKEELEELQTNYDLLKEEKELCCMFYKLQSSFNRTLYEIESNRKIWELNEREYWSMKDIDVYEMNSKLIEEGSIYGETMMRLGDFLEKYRVNMIVLTRIIFDLADLSRCHFETGQKNEEYWSQMFSISCSVHNLRMCLRDIQFENQEKQNFVNKCLHMVIESVASILEFKKEEIKNLIKECNLKEEAMCVKDYADVHPHIELRNGIDLRSSSVGMNEDLESLETRTVK